MMLLDKVEITSKYFRLHGPSMVELEKACVAAPDICRFELIGTSEEGRSIAGIRVGSGPCRVSLVAGAHSDEPVGPETLRTLVLELISKQELFAPIFESFSFYVVPHVNPDGEVRNEEWMTDWPNVASYLTGAFRELPGRDVEFSYPSRRRENRAVSEWLAGYAPFSLHMSLHGMGFSDGAMLLIERNWTYRTEHLQQGFAAAALAAGLRLHDHNRKGEKGFFNIGPGFTTTPEGAAMRAYFLSQGQPETAGLFGDSSMEFIRSLGGDPLCLVTELPLFIVEGDFEPGRPTAYLNFKDELPEIRMAIKRGESIDRYIDTYGLQPLALPAAITLQLRALELGLKTISADR